MLTEQTSLTPGSKIKDRPARWRGRSGARIVACVNKYPRAKWSSARAPAPTRIRVSHSNDRNKKERIECRLYTIDIFFYFYLDMNRIERERCITGFKKLKKDWREWERRWQRRRWVKRDQKTRNLAPFHYALCVTLTLSHALLYTHTHIYTHIHTNSQTDRLVVDISIYTIHT